VPLDKSKIKNILVISLTNIGDVILTFPVVDILKNDFPQAKVSIITGPKAHSLVKDNANFQDVFIFDKQNTSFHTLPWLWMLRRKNYDLVVDLRNSAIPILIGAKRRVSLFAPKPVSAHMKEKHLKRLALIHPFTRESQRKYSGEVSGVDQKYVDDLINSSVGENKPFIVVAPGSAFHKKQWSQTAYAKVCDELVSKYNVKVVFVGD